MNLNDTKYSRFDLCNEMFEAVDVIRKFNPEVSEKYVKTILRRGKLFLTGEGSSRLFPAKNMIYQNAIHHCGVDITTEGATQALEYDLMNYAVFGGSNSGKTKELINLMADLKQKHHHALFGLTANSGTPLESCTQLSDILTCGPEKAVAATKSVIEQVLFYHSLYFNLMDENMTGLNLLADKVLETLTMTIPADIIRKLTDAPMIYFVGRNNGVAEEITLKANEIAHKRSGYLEGTYVVHGIEEVLHKNDVVVIFDPFNGEEKKFKEVLTDSLGLEVIAISSHQTLFPTVIIPDAGIYRNYVELVMGWSILTEIGIAAGLNLDKPVYARKIGNEFVLP